MAFYEFVLQQDNVQNITIHQIKILNYNLHNPLTIKINLNEKGEAHIQLNLHPFYNEDIYSKSNLLRLP